MNSLECYDLLVPLAEAAVVTAAEFFIQERNKLDSLIEILLFFEALLWVLLLQYEQTLTQSVKEVKTEFNRVSHQSPNQFCWDTRPFLFKP